MLALFLLHVFECGVCTIMVCTLKVSCWHILWLNGGVNDILIFSYTCWYACMAIFFVSLPILLLLHLFCNYSGMIGDVVTDVTTS